CFTAFVPCSPAPNSIANSTPKCPPTSNSPSKKISSAASLPPRPAARLSSASAEHNKPENNTAKPAPCPSSTHCSRICASPFACCANPRASQQSQCWDTATGRALSAAIQASWEEPFG